MSTGPDLMDLSAITERLVVVEQDLANLKQQLAPSPAQPWYMKHAGKFEDDEEFAEIIRLGREIRETDRPNDA